MKSNYASFDLITIVTLTQAISDCLEIYERFDHVDQLTMQIKTLQATVKYLRNHMLDGNEPTENVSHCEEVNPIVIRKTPKFPSRDRHLAIRRRKPPSSPESQKSECLSFTLDSEESSTVSSEIE